MEIKPVAFFRSPLTEKFGIPRQAGLAGDLRGEIVLEPEFRSSDAVRGLEEFDFLWLIWGFSLNRSDSKLTVRPPRLGGNRRVGVFASRSPFRPNPLGLSSVRIERIEDGVIHVLGADLADGTPIFDIKPYVTYTDAHPDARSGFVDGNEWHKLEVVFPDELPPQIASLSEEDKKSLREILEQNPRPQYQNDPEKIYGLTFAGRNIRFRVGNGILTVID